MGVVCERGNLKLAFQRVVENKGSAGVDGVGVAEFKGSLKQHWPTIKAKLLAGSYLPSPVRQVDIAKPQGWVRTLGIPTRWNSGASHMNRTFPKSFLDRLGLVSLLDTARGLQCLS